MNEPFRTSEFPLRERKKEKKRSDKRKTLNQGSISLWQRLRSRDIEMLYKVCHNGNTKRKMHTTKCRKFSDLQVLIMGNQQIKFKDFENSAIRIHIRNKAIPPLLHNCCSIYVANLSAPNILSSSSKWNVLNYIVHIWL